MGEQVDLGIPVERDHLADSRAAEGVGDQAGGVQSERDGCAREQRRDQARGDRSHGAREQGRVRKGGKFL